MLISYDKKFIYLKTRKTASTSVEMHFQPFCVPPDSVTNEYTSELKTEFGIVGARLLGLSSTYEFYNHMHAELLVEKLSHEKFFSYFKFCNIRNPFTKLISNFWWHLFKINQFDAIFSLHFSEIKKIFSKFLLVNVEQMLQDRAIYCINNKLIIDAFLRFENLEADTRDLCKTLSLPFNGINHTKKLPKLNIPAEDYFDDSSFDLVNREFSFELSNFCYSLRGE